MSVGEAEKGEGEGGLRCGSNPVVCIRGKGAGRSTEGLVASCEGACAEVSSISIVGARRRVCCRDLVGVSSLFSGVVMVALRRTDSALV